MVERSRSELQREIERLKSQIKAIRTKQATTSTMVTEQAKRFRVGIFVTPLTILGGQVQGSVVWSTPMPSESYKVDAACSAMSTMPSYTITNQTQTGCTVTFTAPLLLAAGTVVIVLAVSPAS